MTPVLPLFCQIVRDGLYPADHGRITTTRNQNPGFVAGHERRGFRQRRQRVSALQSRWMSWNLARPDKAPSFLEQSAAGEISEPRPARLGHSRDYLLSPRS